MYITYADLVLRYDVLKTWADSQAEVNSGLIYYAEIELNSLMASHFSVPFSAAHPTIKDLCMDLAYYKSLVTKDPEKASDVREAIIGRIENIKKGDEYIYTGSGTVIEPTGKSQEIWSPYDDHHATFSMLDYDNAASQVDSGLLEELADERRY